MKTTAKLVGVISAFFIFIFLGLISCKKETVVQNNTIRDTVYVNIYTPITTALITANKWMFQEGRGVRGGTLFYYLRGGSSNTENLDDEYLQLNADNTGISHEQSGTIRQITWNFTSTDNSKLNVNYTNTPANYSIHWENLRCKDNKLYYDEYYTDGNTGQNCQTHVIRIPRP